MSTLKPATGLSRIWARKSVAQIMSENEKSELKRTLGPVNLVLLGIGCIIGAGNKFAQVTLLHFMPVLPCYCRLLSLA